MISAFEAEEIIRENTGILPTETVPFQKGVGRVLREWVVADRDLPPFDRVMMDGIAFSIEGWKKGIRQFKVAGLQAAGVPPLSLEREGDCLEIMTGAVMAEGCDCVVPYEEVSIENGMAAVIGGFEPKAGKFVHKRGSDFPGGAELVQPGVRLTAKEIAVATSCGKSQLSVTRQVRLGIVSTGDELVPVDADPDNYQIRQSNNFALEAALAALGVEDVMNVHLEDDPALIESTLAEFVIKEDVILLSGGISKGKFDYVPAVLEKLGVEKHFQGVRQRPGKPFWYGRMEGGASVFALPGNPLSTLTCFHRYVVPALEQMLGLKDSLPQWAVLDQPYTFRPPLMCFLPVIAGASDTGLVSASPHPAKNSGDFASIVPTTGFVELPAEDRDDFPEGYVARYYRWL